MSNRVCDMQGKKESKKAEKDAEKEAHAARKELHAAEHAADRLDLAEAQTRAPLSLHCKYCLSYFRPMIDRILHHHKVFLHL